MLKYYLELTLTLHKIYYRNYYVNIISTLLLKL